MLRCRKLLIINRKDQGVCMPQGQLTGTRIREKRIAKRVRQADLALRVGISASYLNLIEHNKRRIGGKLLVAIAAELGAEPAALSEGAEAALISSLRAARVAFKGSSADLERTEEFAGRFPGWADVLARAHDRVGQLEHTVETLTDRLTHDPHLAATLHDVISMVTAIRSTAGILAETRGLEPKWRDRFHRNINEDAERLAQRSQALVAYLDGAGESTADVAAPQDELDSFLAALDWHVPALEGLKPKDVAQDIIAQILAQAQPLQSEAGRFLAREWLQSYALEAAELPLQQVQDWVQDNAPDPVQLAAHFGVSVPVAMRRLAALPEAQAGPHGAMGMVSCDASGTLVFRKPLEGFALPRFGAACPLWPLFAALSQPHVPLRRLVRQVGRDAQQFWAFALAAPATSAGYNTPPIFQAHMLLVPALSQAEQNVKAQDMGVSCRICPASRCAVRREPSILADGF